RSLGAERGEATAARGAGAVGEKPRVDAHDVEPVAARRQHSDLLPVGEVGEADGAAGRGLLRRGGVGGDGERHDVLALQPGVEAAVGDPAGGLGEGGAGAAHHALQHRVEAQRAHQRAYHGRQDDDDVVVERRVAAGLARWGGGAVGGGDGGGVREVRFLHRWVVAAPTY
ncbi:hypothetical protein MUK42_18232, partial [Musa troglodytarum]